MKHVFKMIIIIIIIIKLKKKNQNQKGQREMAWGAESGRETIYFNFFFLKSTKIGPQVFIGTEGKVDISDESYA